MDIKFYEDRTYSKEYLYNEGTEFENKATTLHFEFPETVNGVETSSLNKYIVFDIEGNNTDILTSNNDYVIPTTITKLKNVNFNIYLISATEGEDNPFRWVSKKVTLNFNNANEMQEIIVTEEEINIFNDLLSQLNSSIAEIRLLENDFVEFKEDFTQLQEQFEQLNSRFDTLNTTFNELNNEFQQAISQVENVDIDASKSGNTATVTITNKEGMQKSVEIYDGTDYVLTPEDKQEIIDTIEEEVSLDIPTKTSELENDSGFITKEVNNLTNYTLKTSTGSSIELLVNSTTYVMTLNLKDINGNTISTGTVDLPLETMVVNATYDRTTKEIVLTLQSGTTVRFSVADLVSGLVSETDFNSAVQSLQNSINTKQNEITSTNKLSSDLVDDTNSINKFVTSQEKAQITANQTAISNIKDGTNIDSFSDVETELASKGTYSKPSTGIPKVDLANDVQTSLGKADTALQEHQDISGKEDKSNKTNTLDENSTSEQYPNAQLVYNELLKRELKHKNYRVVISQEISSLTEYILPSNYIVGNDSLIILYNNERLICEKSEDDIANYREVGQAGTVSNKVIFGFDIEIGSVLDIIVKGDFTNE